MCIMKKTLYDLYSNLIKSEEWKYYDISNLDETILQEASLGRAFIKKYLGKGEKCDIELFHYVDHVSDDRILHIVSTFFLGVLLYRNSDNVKNNIVELIMKLPPIPRETVDEGFKYIWMLVCLFHDFGYAVEDGLVSLDNKTFDDNLKELPRRPVGIPNVYNKELLKQYNKFRKCRYGKNDHGIVGGVKLYSDLCKLRELKEPLDKNHFWGKTLENRFCIISWVIACHNIFFIPDIDRNKPCYDCFHIDKLVYKDKSRAIQINGSPLLFLFCLVDSIEPLKKVHDYKLLKSITLSIAKDSIMLDYNGLCPAIKDDYKRTIICLDEWLTDTSNDGTLIML